MARRKLLSSVVKVKDGYRVVIYYKNVCYSTGKTIRKKSDFKDGYLTSLWGEGYKQANKEIYELKLYIDSLISEANSKGLEPNTYIKAYREEKSKELVKKAKVSSSYLSDVFSQYLEDKKLRNRFKKEQSFERYEQELERIKEFEDEEYKIKATDVNLRWICDFCEFLAKPRIRKKVVKDKYREYEAKKKYGNSNATINRFIQDFKTFLDWLSVNYKIKVSENIKQFELFETKTVEDCIITFSSDQWEAFKNYKPQSPSEEKTIDAFTFCCYTGLRYSDFITLNSEHILKGYKIKKLAEKTGRAFEVPMNDKALEIFRKYNGDFRQKFPQNQQLNKNLRSILKKIPEFHEEVVS